MPKWAPQAPSLFLREPPAITREVMDPREANRLYTCYPFLASSAAAFSLHLYYRIFLHGHSLRTPLQHLGRASKRNKTVFFFSPRRTLASEILDCKYIPAPFGEMVHLSCPSLEASGVSVFPEMKPSPSLDFRTWHCHNCNPCNPPPPQW